MVGCDTADEGQFVLKHAYISLRLCLAEKGAGGAVQETGLESVILDIEGEGGTASVGGGDEAK